MVDQKIVERKIRRMEEYLRELKKVPIKSLEEFTENTVVKRFVERNIELAIEQMMAVCKHLVAGLDLDEPETYAECFDILHRNKMLPTKHLQTFKAMARYRNRLIHVYDDFDDAITFDVYSNHLKEFSVFARIIRSSINKTVKCS